jgi:hypothetical protein
VKGFFGKVTWQGIAVGALGIIVIGHIVSR